MLYVGIASATILKMTMLQLLQTVWNVKFEIPVTLCRNSTQHSVNFARVRIPRYSSAFVTRVNISVTRILAAAARRCFLSTRTPSITRAEQVCAYYWHEPQQSVFSFFFNISRASSCIRCTVPLVLRRRLRNRFNLLRREYVDSGKYSPAARNRGWRMRNPHARACQRGTGARVRREIGRGWWDYFFLPLFRPFPFACWVSFSCIYSILPLVKNVF